MRNNRFEDYFALKMMRNALLKSISHTVVHWHTEYYIKSMRI